MFGFNRKKKSKGPVTRSGREIADALDRMETRFKHTQSSVSIPALEPAHKDDSPDDGLSDSGLRLVTLGSLLIIVILSGCASLAGLAETQVPALFEPAEVIALDDGHMELRYSYCVEGVCVERLSAVIAVTLEREEGEAIECMVVTQEIRWPDGSENVWIWPAKDSDEGCTAAMEKLAE